MEPLARPLKTAPRETLAAAAPRPGTRRQLGQQGEEEEAGAAPWYRGSNDSTPIQLSRGQPASEGRERPGHARKTHLHKRGHVHSCHITISLLKFGLMWREHVRDVHRPEMSNVGGIREQIVGRSSARERSDICCGGSGKRALM